MDLDKSINEYAAKVGYLPREIQQQLCSCGSKLFSLYSDDEEGGAYLICSVCGKEGDILNSRKYIDSPEQNICSCDAESLLIATGVSYHDDSDDPKWSYVGAKCPECELAGVYVDWQER